MNITRIEQCYCDLLHFGFILLRDALHFHNDEWTQAELEMLHNIPDLISDRNPAGHEYYWYKERPAYLEWVSQNGSEYIQSKVKAYYEPVWKVMEPAILEFLNTGRRPPSVNRKIRGWDKESWDRAEKEVWGQ